MNIITVDRITVSRNSKAADVALTAVIDRPTGITTYQLLTINVKRNVKTSS